MKLKMKFICIIFASSLVWGQAESPGTTGEPGNSSATSKTEELQLKASEYCPYSIDLSEFNRFNTVDSAMKDLDRIVKEEKEINKDPCLPLIQNLSISAGSLGNTGVQTSEDIDQLERGLASFRGIVTEFTAGRCKTRKNEIIRSIVSIVPAILPKLTGSSIAVAAANDLLEFLRSESNIEKTLKSYGKERIKHLKEKLEANVVCNASRIYAQDYCQGEYLENMRRVIKKSTRDSKGKKIAKPKDVKAIPKDQFLDLYKCYYDLSKIKDFNNKPSNNFSRYEKCLKDKKINPHSVEMFRVGLDDKAREYQELQSLMKDPIKLSVNHIKKDSKKLEKEIEKYSKILKKSKMTSFSLRKSSIGGNIGDYRNMVSRLIDNCYFGKTLKSINSSDLSIVNDNVSLSNQQHCRELFVCSSKIIKAKNGYGENYLPLNRSVFMNSRPRNKLGICHSSLFSLDIKNSNKSDLIDDLMDSDFILKTSAEKITSNCSPIEYEEEVESISETAISR